VLEPPASGRYPPDTVWRFPPPPVSRVWLVAAIVGGLVGLLAAGGAIAFLAVNRERDLPGIIDDSRVIKTAARECRLMRSTVEGVPYGYSEDERLDALDDQNTAIEKMVDRIHALDAELRASDRPVDQWLDDWRTLAARRHAYVDHLRRGDGGSFRVPRAPDGDPINERMNLAGEEVCKVPKVLLEPELAGTQEI
jgi:hypothetical protein